MEPEHDCVAEPGIQRRQCGAFKRGAADPASAAGPCQQRSADIPGAAWRAPSTAGHRGTVPGTQQRAVATVGNHSRAPRRQCDWVCVSQELGAGHPGV
ncbi:hypothetical protein BC831DRAFT_449887 [Entophlyctis helioformis]|nr:hypothetical protein BC831DRAFT_449887 [Entophlyctis helioformis]